MKDLKRIFQCLLPYRKPFILAVLFVVVETSFELIIPMIMADIIDVGIAASDIHYIMVKGVEMAGCALLSLITGLLYAKYAAIAANGFAYELREREFSKIQEYSFANLDHFETSSLITRMTSDVTVMQNLISARPASFGSRSCHARTGTVDGVFDQCKAGFGVCRMCACACPDLDRNRSQDRTDVWSAAESRRSGEFHRGRKSDGNSCGKGFRTRYL